MNKLRAFVNYCELNYSNEKRAEDFNRSLRELISILFAVIFAIGLDKIAEAKTNVEYAMLLTAYLTVMLSWWGYHYGTTIGPRETNGLLYLIDSVIIVFYWTLIQHSFDLEIMLKSFIALFFLYTLWEGVRCLSNNTTKDQFTTIRTAFYLNLFSCFSYLFLFLLYYKEVINNCEWFYVAIALSGMIGYRFLVHRVYSK